MSTRLKTYMNVPLMCAMLLQVKNLVLILFIRKNSRPHFKPQALEREKS